MIDHANGQRVGALQAADGSPATDSLGLIGTERHGVVTRRPAKAYEPDALTLGYATNSVAEPCLESFGHTEIAHARPTLDRDSTGQGE